MNNIHLQKLIQDFSPEQLSRFLADKCTLFAGIKETLSSYDDDFFQGGIKLGEIRFELFEEIIVCAFKTNHTLSERSGKKAQYEKAKKILRDRSSDAGIFVFYDELGSFRFSLVYTNYLGKKKDWSTFKRFTYYVNKQLTNKTFLQRIGESEFYSLEDIKEAFSVEKVTGKFFDEFRVVFEKTKKEFEKTNRNTVCLWLKSKYSDEEYKEQINKFAFTFLGRIIFLYFLLRKGWIEGEKNFIRNRVEDHDYHGLYLGLFQPLFFDVFATPERERKPEITLQYQNTPYLNGGLFERSELEIEMLKANKFVLFEDAFLRSIISDFFEAYNFTVDENSPNDQEVSIDPEMLGKVFENTLAEEDRGKKGTFYTPREVVHFMVKEALLQYLKNETSIDPETLHDFIFNETFNLEKFSRADVRLIDQKLEGVKVLDPAVGSAAFPVEMMQVLIALRKQLDVKVGKNVSEVALRKSFIKNNLYGVDIDSSAIEIAKLRLWLSLIVDYDRSEVEPLPNLDFQFRVGNSLQEKIGDFDIFNESNMGPQGVLFKDISEYEKLKDRMLTIKDKFYLSRSENEKRKLKREFDELEHHLIQAVLNKYRSELESQIKNQRIGNTEKLIQVTVESISRLEQKVRDGTYKLFKPDFHFSEVFDRKSDNGQKIGGFDIVIGNPPYGVAVEEEIKVWHGLGSKDSYGVFISTALKRFLKPGGVLSYIVSDTWLTIKTHRQLRDQVLANQLHKVIRLHQDCFEATVNACIISITNKANGTSQVIAADLTNISTRKDVDEVREKLYHLERFIGQSTPRFAVYQYSQVLIQTNSNQPIIISSPKLFLMMNDQTCPINKREINNKIVNIRQITINGKIIDLVRLGDVSDVNQGLATGDNHSYLFQDPNARGTYRDINQFRKYVITEFDLIRITNSNDVRLKIIESGFHKNKNEANFDYDRWFDGRYIVPYDKGGESDSESGWLPNYYVPPTYFIDWSQAALTRMKSLTIGQRDHTNRNQIAAVFRNVGSYFFQGISYSWAGVYCPTFRISQIGPYDHGSSNIFCSFFNNEYLLGILVSKIIKYLSRTMINHSINFGVDDVKEIPIILPQDKEIERLVAVIIEKQKQLPRYDYINNEQKIIDRIIYSLFGFNEDDICEIETWYARRYPKLMKLRQ